MSSEGYTLVEMLIALVTLGLAMVGYAQGVQVLAKWQASTSAVVASVEATQAAQTRLDRLFEGNGPFRSDKPEFSGQAAAFGFGCGASSECGASVDAAGADLILTTVAASGARSVVRLPKAAPARFLYRGTGGTLEAWPPTGSRQVLRAVELVGGASGTPIVVERLARDEPMSCDFDSVLQDCR